MAKFPSQEWVDLFKESLNQNKNYEDAALTWEGDFVFLILPDETLKAPVALYLDLYHGKCREARMLSSPEEKSAAFIYQGPYGNWKKLIGKEIDPIKGMLTGKFKLKGQAMKVMSYTRAAKELVETATKIPTEFD